jgi:hypothetical protein
MPIREKVMIEQRKFKDVVDKYTEYLIHEFVSFLEVPFFDGQCFIDYFSGHLDDISLRTHFGINEEAFSRLLSALISVEAITMSDGVLKRGRYGGASGDISKLVDEVFADKSFEEQYQLFDVFLNSETIHEQIVHVGTLKSYLIDSIAYDVLVVRRFFSPKATMQALMTGKSVTSYLFDLNSTQIFDHYKTRPNLLNVYGHGFASSHFMSDIDFISKIEFSDFDKLIDIGGCYGNLGRLILSSTSKDITYECLDLAETSHAFSAELQKATSEFGEKFKFVAGNFFNTGVEISGIESKTFEKLFLGWILHDWNDEQCINVLKKCTKHMTSESELYIFEILPNDRKMSFNFTDWLMLVMADGYERTSSQYEKLFVEAGLELVHTEKTKSGRSMMKLKAKNG